MTRATYKHLVGAFVGAIDTKQSPQDFPEQKLSFEEDLVLIKTVPKQINPDRKAVLDQTK